VLKDSRFNLQEERVYNRNIEYNAQTTSICLLSKLSKNPENEFPTTLTNPQRIMVSSCFEEYLNYAD
jgi:hypothetical protein